MIAMPLLLDAVPAPAGAQSLLAANVEPQEVPGLSEFILSLIAPNIIAAAAETAMLPLTIFFALFAVAITRLAPEQSAILRSFFEAVANAMLMATFERRREFAVMLALGATPRAVTAVVLYEALALGVLSLTLGSAITFPLMVWFHAAPPDMSWAFGDVTLMAMIGSFVGWQAALVVFFLAPW